MPELPVDAIFEKIPFKRMNTAPNEPPAGSFKIGVNDGTALELICLEPNRNYKPHHHKDSDARIYIITGSGTVAMDGQIVPYWAGDTFSFPRNMRHGFNTLERTLIFSIQEPALESPTTGEFDFHYD